MITHHDDLIPHMRRVQKAERNMHDLAIVWQMIESSAAISCPEEVAPLLPTLARTRERFEHLQSRLIGQLVEESRDQVGDELSAKAQCAIDILVRNLFERTADVGFLAVDETVRDFCAAGDSQSSEQREAMHERLGEYQRKYTVYDDIVLLAPDGRILMRLLPDSGDGWCHDSWVTQVPTRDGYHEFYGISSLGDPALPALLYAHRVTSASGVMAGILVLRFRLADELERIFQGMADEREQVSLILLDDQNRVVASNDPAHVPLGARLRAVPPGQTAITSFCGREYLAVACAAHPYQGYAGPGWRAQAMMSLLTAFTSHGDSAADAGSGARIALDNEELNRIQADADGINRELRRVVWNGQLMARRHSGDSLRLKSVLSEVNTAGHRTRERVALAIRDLYRTAMARGRQQAAQLARLAADILDRNLYERANDCRWWAQSPALRDELRKPVTADGEARIQQVLDHINGLYTVYSRLVVFDDTGVVRGVSRADSAPARASNRVPDDWLASVRRLQGSQAYAVTPFADTDFHAAGPTYTYLAAITDAGGQRLGGIGIVFNSRDELAAMLRDVAGSRRCFAAFVGPGGDVLSTSLDTVDVELVKAARSSGTGLVEHGNAHFVVARTSGSGYREFKSSDGYDNGVEVLVGLRLGPVERRRTALSESALMSTAVRNRSERLELAVFQVGPGRYALPASMVLQALPREGIVRMPAREPTSLGLQEVVGDGPPTLVRVLCAREMFGLKYAPRESDGVVVILVSPHDRNRPVLGLRVDDVMGITEVPKSAWQTSPLQRGGGSAGARILGIVDCPLADLQSSATSGSRTTSPSRALVQILDVHAILDRLVPGASRGDAGSRPGGLDAIEALLATPF
jgi:chemotaxis signal transduction protein